MTRRATIRGTAWERKDTPPAGQSSTETIQGTGKDKGFIKAHIGIAQSACDWYTMLSVQCTMLSLRCCITESLCPYVTVSQCPQVTVSLCPNVTVSGCPCVLVSPYHCATVPPCIGINIPAITRRISLTFSLVSSQGPPVGGRHAPALVVPLPATLPEYSPQKVVAPAQHCRVGGALQKLEGGGKQAT